MPNSTPPPEHAAGPGTDAAVDGTKAAADAPGQDSATTASGAPPPRLELDVDERLLRLIRFMRSPHAADARVPPVMEEDEGEEEEQGGKPAKRKGRRKLCIVPVRSLQLGHRKIAGTGGVDIVAKFHYRRPRKMVCQLRRREEYPVGRIDILWSNIKAMHACFDDPRFDTLRIHLRSRSEQYSAHRPPQGVHPQWQRCTDLPERTLCLQFDKGTLERSYGKMLYTDPSLMLLPLPPPGDDDDEQEEEEAHATDTQQPADKIVAAVPVPPYPYVDTPQAAMPLPGTRMMIANSASTHENRDTKLYDSSELARMHSLYK